MREFIKFVFGFLFISAVVVGAVMLQLHTREIKHRWNPEHARRSENPMPVRTVSVSKRDVADIIGGTAITYPSATASMSIVPRDNAIVDRLVASVPVKPGDVVKKDDVLIRFDESMFAAEVVERKIALQTSKHLFNAMEDLETLGAVATLKWKEAESEVATAKYRSLLSEYELAACRVRSPLNGVVEATHVVAGMRVTGATPLAVVHQLDPIHVQMDFPIERLQAVDVGQRVEVVLDAFPGKKFFGDVVQISTTASPRTRVIPVTVEVANPDNAIRAGISGYARIAVGKADATTIPQVAVIDKLDRAMVFCVEDGQAKIREVSTGPVLGDGRIEIVEGLAEGEEVVVFGHNLLRDDDVVDSDWEVWTNLEEPEDARPAVLHVNENQPAATDSSYFSVIVEPCRC